MSLVRPVTSTGHGLQGTVSQPFDGTFSWEPAGYLLRRASADRGKRTKFSTARYYGHLHLAIDYIVIEGTPVRAMKSGTCIGHGKNPVDGAWLDYIRLRNGTKYQVVSLSYHLSANSYRHKIGAQVKRGATIALSGNTGWSTGPHLHQELIRAPRGASTSEIFSKGLRLDPQPFIDGRTSLKEIAP